MTFPSGEWLLVDVRLAEQHQTGAPEGAVNVPIYEVRPVLATGGGEDDGARAAAGLLVVRGQLLDPCYGRASSARAPTPR